MFKNIKFSFQAIFFPILMLIAIWVGFLVQHTGLLEACSGAIIPLRPEGLKGVVFSPFLHGSLEHISGNSLPIVVLMFLLYQFYPKIANAVFFISWFVGGLIVWALPTRFSLYEMSQNTRLCIIGASGIIYVLAFFLFFSGVFRKNIALLAITLLVGLYYGGMVWGVFPEEFFNTTGEPSKISWQSHLTGAILGIFLAFLYRNSDKKYEKFIWEYPNYYSEKDDKLWQEYKEKHPQDFEELPYFEEKEDIWKKLDEIRKIH